MSTEKKPEISPADAALRKRLQRIGTALLVVGLLAAELIFVRATPDNDSGAIGYEVVGGVSYPIMPGESKTYENGLERMGGKSAVLAAEITQWFASLWHGRRLAYTVLVLSVGGSLVCFFLAHLLSLPLRTEEPSGGRTKLEQDSLEKN